MKVLAKEGASDMSQELQKALDKFPRENIAHCSCGNNITTLPSVNQKMWLADLKDKVSVLRQSLEGKVILDRQQLKDIFAHVDTHNHRLWTYVKDELESQSPSEPKKETEK